MVVCGTRGAGRVPVVFLGELAFDIVDKFLDLFLDVHRRQRRKWRN